MVWPRSKSRPKLRLPVVLNRAESEALAEALAVAIEQSAPGNDRLSILYTLLRKNERILRKLQAEEADGEFEDL